MQRSSELGIEDYKKKILEGFKENNYRAGYILSEKELFFILYADNEGIPQKKEALWKLRKEGLIDCNLKGYSLTKAGEDYIYGDK